MTGRQEYRMGVGAASILMIFMVLSLTTLGVLAYASAHADLALTQRRQAQVEAYYAAVAEGQRKIARIDGALLAAREDLERYEVQVRALGDDSIRVSRDMTLSFTIPVGESQQLEIALRAMDPDNVERYVVTRHCLVNVAEWRPEEIQYVERDEGEQL